MRAINLAPRRTLCRRGMPLGLWVVAAPFIPVLVLVGAVARAIEFLETLWSDLWRECWMAWRACSELPALERFMLSHAGPGLDHTSANTWSWMDDGLHYQLTWIPSDDRQNPDALELTASSSVELLPVTLRTDEDLVPILRSEPEDRDRLQVWARDTGEPIVRHIYELTGALPLLTVEERTARVRVPMTTPLKPLIGALELLLTAMPQKRRAA